MFVEIEIGGGYRPEWINPECVKRIRYWGDDTDNSVIVMDDGCELTICSPPSKIAAILNEAMADSSVSQAKGVLDRVMDKPIDPAKIGAAEETHRIGWQTMATAPRDGTGILVCIDDKMMTAEWCILAEPPTWICSYAGSQVYRIRPSRWMPLPEPPGGKGDERSIV